jgi:hypothetical protein
MKFTRGELSVGWFSTLAPMKLRRRLRMPRR